MTRSTVCISLWLTKDLCFRAKSVASKQGITLSQLVRRALTHWLDRYGD